VHPENAKKVGIWYFCNACFENMTNSPARQLRLNIAAQAGGEGGDAGDAGVETGSLDSQDLPEAPYQGIQYIHCSRCGRRIPEGGSKALGSNAFCPECYQVVAPPPPVWTEDAASAAEPPLRPPANGPQGAHCEACQRSVPPDDLARMEGFAICNACLTTDINLAVTIARERHQLRLQALRRELSA
jgi:hypothetical protein